MSARADRRVAPPAMDAETHAAQWLERHDREELGEGDRAAFQSWLAASPANKLAYLRLYAAWRDADRLSVLRGSAEEKPQRWRALSGSSRFVRRRRGTSRAMAVSGVPCFALRCCRGNDCECWARLCCVKGTHLDQIFTQRRLAATES